MEKDAEKKLIEIQERSSKASIISAIAASAGVFIGTVGIIIGILSYQNSIAIQASATTPYVSLQITYGIRGDKISLLNQGNGQALVRDITVTDTQGRERSFSKEIRRDPNNGLNTMKEILGLKELFDSKTYRNNSSYSFSYFWEPFVMRGNSRESIFSALDNEISIEFDDQVNRIIRSLDFQNRIKIDYCNIDQSKCYEYVR